MNDLDIDIDEFYATLKKWAEKKFGIEYDDGSPNAIYYELPYILRGSDNYLQRPPEPRPVKVYLDGEYPDNYAPRVGDIVEFTVIPLTSSEEETHRGVITSIHLDSVYPPYNKEINSVRTGGVSVQCDDGIRRGVHRRYLVKKTPTLEEMKNEL